MIHHGFQLDLVCASQNNKVLKTLKWGFKYDYNKERNEFKVKLL